MTAALLRRVHSSCVAAGLALSGQPLVALRMLRFGHLLTWQRYMAVVVIDRGL